MLAYQKQRLAKDPLFREYRRKSLNTLRAERKLLVLKHYSRGDLRCACCDEGNVNFLTIDHIGGWGGEHRKEIGIGRTVYEWIVKNNFPTGFQVLCMNCNWASRYTGVCPHKQVF